MIDRRFRMFRSNGLFEHLTFGQCSEVMQNKSSENAPYQSSGPTLQANGKSIHRALHGSVIQQHLQTEAANCDLHFCARTLSDGRVKHAHLTPAMLARQCSFSLKQHQHHTAVCCAHHYQGATNSGCKVDALVNSGGSLVVKSVFRL